MSDKRQNFVDIDKVISKDFDDLVNLSKVDTSVSTWFDTGVYALNYICSRNLLNGIPVGKVSRFSGLKSTGKSMIAASIMRDEKIDYVVIVETEAGAAQELIEFAGVNKEKVRLLKGNTFESYRIKKKDSTIEEIADNKLPKNKITEEWIYIEGISSKLKRFVNSIEFNKIKSNILIVLDSLSNLQSVRELSGGYDMGKRAQEVSRFFRCFDLAFERTNMAFIFTNKLYTNLGNPYDPYVESGGVNTDYNPSLAIRFSEATTENEDIGDAEKKKEKERRTTALGGSMKMVRADVLKSRFGTDGRRVNFIIDYSVGPLKFSGLFGLCKDFGLIEKSGSMYKINGMLEDRSFYRKDFTSRIIEYGEKKFIEELQKKLEELELKFKENKMELQQTADEGAIADDSGEDFNEEYGEMVKKMAKEIDG
jgi:RecA/RadA recombinase